ncbi:MAG TPA: pyridoxine 5'-phosphate synthase [Micropepsaceae bacterium]|nr:pyridoxine 5'-phosphate synthase [Micropepsaceae bacterium]
MTRLRLGVNIDHVATVRNARGGPHPDPVRAAKLAMAAGADGITAHLREDRRHINDADLAALVREKLPLNLEMAATSEMLEIALKARPHACCIVPERREERTTEGGLDAAGAHDRLAPMVKSLKDAGIAVTLFIEADLRQFEAALSLGVPVVELHTGAYHDAGLTGDAARVAHHLNLLRDGARRAVQLGLEVHAGHGLTFDNVGAIAVIPEIVELQIGHFLVGEAIFSGLQPAIRRMRAIMDQARGAL